ncbi:MAG: DNA polymerase I [Lachnospiraceae bacterium]|nr:DNA polymerase I [Lachnospiraceae bacterium]MBR5066750.1 DNA polymerase I [Lachnospiraceae bacterium]MBR5916995.1 DNA polymerase I [Lachnospiraceae bacterium]
MEKLLLIDGNSIMNRAFYGVPDLTNVNGLHTNAVYGFLNILFRFLDEENPDYLAIAFDLHAPTFRHKLFEAYKGTRKGMPDELRQQVPYIKNLVKEMNIKTLELEGYEADDLLGTMAKRAQNMGMEVSLLSGDRDLLQISDEHIKIRVPKTIKGQTTVEDYYPADVVAKYNVTPSEFIHLKALMGDSSDNIPGVPKVGEKTASELIIKYHSLDGIYENVEEISKDSIRNSLKDNKDLAYLCLKLATIETNAPVDVDFSELKNELTYSEGGYNILQELGLRTYLKKFEDNMSKIKNDVSLDNLTVTEIENNDALMSLLNGLNNASVSLVKGTFGSVIGINDKFYKVSFMMNINPFVRKVLFEGNNKLIVFKASDAFETLEDDDFKKQSKDIVKNIYALDLAAYLLNPLNNSYTAESLLSDYLGITVRSDSLDAKEQALVAYGFNELKKNFDERLNETEQYKLYTDIELPLSLVLFEMERTGILVDRAGLKKYEEDLSVSINSLEKKIYEEAGEEFNILSPKQLGVILFEKMNMPSSKKTKTGYSTSADVLEKLAADYPFVSNILEYRTLTKLKSTYAVGLASAIGSDGRIHSHFLQTVTATGRISSAEPNLQNIPVRTDLGRQLRKVFIPKDGYIFADADYSQIELRILAHLSNDTTLIDAFNSDKDIHAVTASKVFNVPIDEVTSSQRRAAKVVNFGIIYGMSSFSLGQDLEITRKDAEKYIKEYFEGYPGIRKYLDDCVENAKEKGYSLTAFLRRRPIPELKASQFMQREFGKRVAMNAPIQGTAADIMKIAMINVRDALKKNGLSSEILIQVHDELLLEIKTSEKEEVVKILQTEMENAYKLSVPLSVDLNVGENWYEAK